MGLGQLTSPPISAKAVADWFLARIYKPTTPFGFSNPTAPLSSVDVLLSPSGAYKRPDGNSIDVDIADKAHVEQSFEQWRQRLVGNPASIGVMYFCGHGVMSANQYLLTADFGDNPGNPWSKAFDLSLTVRALEREVPGPLYFLVDACRQVPKTFAATLGANPQALRVVQLNKPLVNSSRLELQAAGEGALAFAVPNKVSRFTDALLRALSGFCGEKVPGQNVWQTTGEELARSVRHILEQGNKTVERRQQVEQVLIGPTVLQVDTTPPRVMVDLDLLPVDRRSAYRLYLRSLKGDASEHDAAAYPWRLDVPGGFYDVGAKPTEAGAIALISESEQLRPPNYEYVFSAQP
jgi:hypothetical protein